MYEQCTRMLPRNDALALWTGVQNEVTLSSVGPFLPFPVSVLQLHFLCNLPLGAAFVVRREFS